MSMMNPIKSTGTALSLLSAAFSGHAGAMPPALEGVPQKSPLTSFVIQPKRIVWVSDRGVENSANLLKNHRGQAVLSEPVPPLVIKPGGAIVIDFGMEITGSVELFTPDSQPKGASIRIRFGESVAETMADIGQRGAQNDHALRDQVVKLPWLGKTAIGPSGFRFVRIDNADPKIDVQLSQVRAILTLRDIAYVGSFKCSDERLNRIWETGAYTVHLNMQDYLWDGVKRDRLVWLGDMHPEVSVINSVFGFNEVVPKSLDMTRDVTPVTAWMNGISSYSMWWILIHDEWYLHHGNLDYLKQQQPYLTALLKRLATFVDAGGKENLDGMRFLDWPTAWLSKNVLGITPVAPGCAKVKITPHLGRLAWAEGTYPTPKGPIHVRHDKQPDGTIKTTVKLPEGIVRVK